MNPWVAGRIVEQMQIEARNRGRDAQLVPRAIRAEARAKAVHEREPRRERVGLAVARLGLRIAGTSTDRSSGRRFVGPELEAGR